MIVLALLAAPSAQAATCTANSGGNWSNAASWNCHHVPTSVDDVVVNGSTLTLDVGSTVLSVTVNSGTLQHSSATSYSLTISGALVVSGAISNTGAGTFALIAASVTNNGTLASDALSVSGALVSSGTLNVRALTASGDVTHNGGTFTATSLVFQKAGTQGATFYGTAASVGNLTVNSGSSVSSTDYSTINITGALINNGALSLPNTILVVNGTSAQAIGGANAATLGGLTINNAAGLTLSQDLTLTGLLTLTSGIISSTSNTLILSKSCDQSSVAGGSTASHVAGKVRLAFPNYQTSCIFPVGSGGRYAPIVLAYAWNAATSGGSVTGSTTSGDHPDTVSGISGINSSRSVNRYWTLTPETGASFASYDATFQFCDAAACGGSDVDAVATPASFTVAEKTGSAWSTPTSTAPSATTRRVSGITAFGSFAIGEAGSVVVPTCIADTFSTGTLNTALWNVAGIGYTPQVVTSPAVPSNRLRLTDNVGNRSTFAQLKKWFPGANNRVVVQFDHYVWGGNGADGITLVLSDASIAPSPGGYGGSLGYANRDSINGFSGGWLGVGLDEYGNYPNSSEGRRGYPAGYVAPLGANVAAGFYANSIAVRGSGVAQSSGYALLANSGTLSPSLATTSAVPNRYRLIVDNSNNVNAYVSLERNTGSGFVTVIPAFDVRGANSGQAAVPANMLLSFTGSTGGNNNYHEIGNVSVCATRMTDPGGSSDASAFECLETGTNTPWPTTSAAALASRKPLYTKLAGTSFTLDIAALKTDGTLETNYVAAGGNSKYVKVELFDDTTPAASCAAYASPLAAQTVSFISGSFSTAAGRTLSGNFSLGTAYRKLRCRVRECVDSSCGSFTALAPACSSDQFSLRPSAATLLTTPLMAAAPSSSDTKTIKAGAAFTLQATTSASAGYAGALTLDAGKLSAQNPAQDATAQSGGVVGALTPSALTANGSVAGASYSEVGYLYLAPGAYRDETFTAVDSATGDCITSTAGDNNLADTLVGGKYGCHIGNKTAVAFGRFIPDSFVASAVSVVPRSDLATCSASVFTYLGEPLRLSSLTLTAKASGGVTTTQNYAGVFAKLDLSSSALKVQNLVAGAQQPSPGFTNFYSASRLLVAYGGTSLTDSYPASDPDCPNARTLAWCKGRALMSLDFTVSRASSPDGPFAGVVLGISPSDGDGVKMNILDFQQNYTGSGALVGDGKKIATLAGNELRFGRLKLSNSFGGDRSSLAVPAQAQYWSGLTWVRNSADSCTPIARSAVSLTGALSANNKVTADVILSSGGADIVLACPYASCPVVGTPSPALTGTVGLCVDLGPDHSSNPALNVVCSASSASLPYLQGRWPPGSAYDNDPAARATFGVFSPETKKTIHVREVY